MSNRYWSALAPSKHNVSCASCLFARSNRALEPAQLGNRYNPPRFLGPTPGANLPFMGWFSAFFTSDPRSKSELTFGDIPDGRYLVAFQSEAGSHDQFVLVTFKVAAGPHKGADIPMFFKSAKARELTREAQGDFISRMSYLGDACADRLDSALRHAEADTDGLFIVEYRDGAVTSVPDYDAAAVERMLSVLRTKQEGTDASATDK